MEHQPLHKLQNGAVCTAGRYHEGRLTNAYGAVLLEPLPLENGQLVRVEGHFDGEKLSVARYESFSRGDAGAGWTRGLELRQALYRQIRTYFAECEFLEVETPQVVDEPGTDVFLDPLPAIYSPEPGGRETRKWLHTSPEFKMKALLVAGHERIFQVTKAFRNGEVSKRHRPEFSILEFYRAWESVEAIMQDVENIVSAFLELEGPIERITMQELFLRSCGIDILAAQTRETLVSACRAGGLKVRLDGAWDQIYFELMVEYVDPFLESMGPVFVTRWPVRQAVLAAACEDDSRAAERFELYVNGLELCNGFQELCDPEEQRRRFKEDIERRRELNYPELPMPEVFLHHLSQGLPPSAGVAVGLDRLLMLKLGTQDIADVIALSGFD